jgi:hypothetical protein
MQLIKTAYLTEKKHLVSLSAPEIYPYCYYQNCIHSAKDIESQVERF